MIPRVGGFALRHLAAIVLACVGITQAAAAVCVGDCDGNGDVDASELTTLIYRIERCAGDAIDVCDPARPCANADRDGSGTLTIDEVMTAVRNVIYACREPEPAATGTPRPSPTAPPLPSATASPTPTPVTSDTCGNGLIEDRETCESCPADCVVSPCTGTTPLRTVEVNLAVPTGQDASSATLLVSYRSSRVGLPGTGSSASSRVKNRPANSIFAVNDLDYGLRVVITRSSRITPGRVFTVDFDSCPGAAAPTAADFRCTVQGCASSFGTVDGCTCAVGIP